MTDIQTSDRWMRPDEAARYSAIAKSTLAKLRVFGGGPVFAKRGHSVVYRQSDIDAWLEVGRVRSTSDAGKAE
jgi:predicted DNA-binding transcriptional regulator AlpA